MSGSSMDRRRARVPVWMMGLSNALFGMYGGILVISVPQLLSARQVPEATIAAMTAVMISPGFWTFLVCPVLDVRFSRRWYAVVTALVAAALLSLALLNLTHLAWVEGLLVVGFFFANLYQSALGGWLSSITTAKEKNTLSVWVTIANISGGGAMAMIAGELVQRVSPNVAALLLCAAVLLPIGIFPSMQAPGPDRRRSPSPPPQRSHLKPSGPTTRSPRRITASCYPHSILRIPTCWSWTAGGIPGTESRAAMAPMRL